MEHSLPIDPAARPWRTLTLIAATVAVIEFMVLFSVFVAKPLVAHLREAAVASATGSVDIPKPPPAGKPKLARAQTTVLVLNGNGRNGAAGAEAARIRARRYRISDVSDARRTDYVKSIVMYRAGRRAEAMRLARDLRVPVIGPLDGMTPRELLGAQLAVIVGDS